MATGPIHMPYRRDTCLCGCERKPRAGHLFAWGCKANATAEQFRTVWTELHRTAPLCKCGCGRRVRLNFRNFDAWVRVGAQPLFNQYADGCTQCSSNQSLALSTLEKQAILGTLLGDSSICYPNPYSKSPRLSSTHGYCQKEWAEHKAAFLHRLNATTYICKNDGWGEQSIRTRTACNPSLIAIHDLVVSRKKKRVSREWLDAIGDIGLAWWICDDGSVTPTGLFLHTEGFSKRDNELIAEWFCDHIGKTTVVQNKRKKAYFISIASWTQIEVGRRVKPYIPDCMRYKLVSCNESRPRKSGGRVRHRSRRQPLFFCEQPASS